MVQIFVILQPNPLKDPVMIKTSVIKTTYSLTNVQALLYIATLL